MNVSKTNITSLHKTYIFKTDMSQLFKLLNTKKVFFMLILIN